MLKRLKLCFFGLVFVIHLHGQDGGLDPTFNIFGTINGIVNVVAEQTDGKLIIGGSFSQVGFLNANNIARLLPDGTPDPSFQIGTGLNNEVFDVKINSNGSILVGGRFTSYNGATANRIVCLLETGAIDTNFTTGLGFDDAVEEISLLADGKVFVSGWFTYYNLMPRNYLARLHADGLLDTLFDPNIGPNERVLAHAILSNGKIAIGGWFNTFQNISSNHFALIDSNGVLDTSFNVGVGFNNWVFEIAALPNGSMLVGGIFSSYQGVGRIGLARIQANGNIDLSFNNFSGINGVANVIAPQSNGNILIGGSFSNFNGISTNNILRLNANGSLDQTFQSGTGANNRVKSIVRLGNGQLIIAGAFSAYNNVSSPGVARLINALPVSTVYLESNPKKAVTLYPNPIAKGQTLSIQQHTEIAGQLFRLFDTAGSLVFEWQLNKTDDALQLPNLSAGLFIWQLLDVSGSVQVGKLIVAH